MIRVLFVDDEPRVLQGLRRMLHGMRSKWQMEFASSGAEALEAMAKTRFDVVVSDLRMPGMDGVTLLNEVMQRHPNMVRIVLSADTDEQAIMRYVGKTHMFLSKPCDAPTLVSAISRACAIQAMLSQPELQRLIARIETLPSLPTLYLELSAELRKPEPSMNAVGEIISRDMSMVARVLQLVNSAYFGFYGRVTSPERAVVLLGTKTIQSLVLSFKVFTQFDQSQVKAFRIDSMMNHGLATAAYARTIARLDGKSSDVANDAFTAGLLHDLGKLVLASSLPTKYADIQNQVRVDNQPTWLVEKKMLGASHAELGAYLVGLWGLPDSVVEALAFHHFPGRSPSVKFSPLTAVHVADAWEHQNHPSDNLGPMPEVEAKYIKALGMGERMATWRARCDAAGSERKTA